MIGLGMFLYCLGWLVGSMTGFAFGYQRALKDKNKQKVKVTVSDLYPPKQ